MAWSENRERMEEGARVYPIKKLLLQVSKYAVLHLYGDYTEKTVIFEDSMERCHVSAIGGHSRLSEEGILYNDLAVQVIIDEIVLDKGVRANSDSVLLAY